MAAHRHLTGPSPRKIPFDGEPPTPEHLRNLDVAGALSGHTDAVNKTRVKFATEVLAPRKLVVANFSLNVS